jgi:hypothetical protein
MDSESELLVRTQGQWGVDRIARYERTTAPRNGIAPGCKDWGDWIEQEIKFGFDA